jgi:hypothetical protein
VHAPQPIELLEALLPSTQRVRWFTSAATHVTPRVVASLALAPHCTQVVEYYESTVKSSNAEFRIPAVIKVSVWAYPWVTRGSTALVSSSDDAESSLAPPRPPGFP